MTAAVIALEAGDYSALITPIGGALVALRHRGRDLVHQIGDTPPMPLYRGAVLAPWPNRIADGRYEFAGETHQLPINEVPRGCALHGLVLWSTWQVIRATPTEVQLCDTVWPRPGYPFALEITADYQLTAETGLAWTVTARNVGDAPAPYGTSIHPYLVGGAGPVDDWTFELPAAEVIDVDPERLLPRATVPVGDLGFDFRTPRRIADTAIDHAFTGLRFDGGDRASATLSDATGAGVRMTWDRRCGWVQVHTTDLPGADVHRTGLAFEPMTCPPDAFNSGDGLIVLQPGEAHSAWWQIEAVEAPAQVTGSA